MSSATYPPRCPNRAAMTRCLTILFASLVGSTTAAVSLNGQELDYRFVNPANHVQPWPIGETDSFITPCSIMHIASKWRTNLTNRKTAPETADEQPTSGPELEKPKSKVEVLVMPQPAEKPTTTAVPPSVPKPQPTTKLQPATKPRDCYQAPALSNLSANIALPAGKLPTNAAAKCVEQTPPNGDLRLAGAWAVTEHHWSATCLRHRPLYFEEINAERYGYTPSYCLQPLFSAAKFFATIPALPYKMAVERPRDCVYTLGHYRPGSCAPRRWHHLPWQLNAAAIETGFIAGLILLVP